MKKRCFLFFVFGALVFSLAACNTSNTNSNGSNGPAQGHQHTYSSVYSYDDVYHWYEATCGHNVVSGKEKHTFNDVVTNPTYASGGYTTHTCTVCGYSYVDSQTEKLTFTVVWKNWDGTVLETDTNLDYNTIPHYDGITPSKNDDETNAYSFNGWYPEISPVTNDITYVAQFDTYKYYYISYELNGGTNSAKNPSCYNGLSGTITLEEPTETGYTFVGWTGSNGDIPETNVSFSGNDSMNRNYVANWRPTVYTITYVLDGGINSMKNPSTYSTGDTITLGDASKECYSFGGWYRDQYFTQRIKTLDGLHENLIIYAKFIPNTYIGTFDAGEGNIYKTVTIDGVGSYHVNAGEHFDPFAKCTYVSGKGYIDYFTNSNGKTIKNDFQITENITIYPHFIKFSNGYSFISSSNLSNLFNINKTAYNEGETITKESYFNVHPYYSNVSIYVSAEIFGGEFSIKDLTDNTYLVKFAPKYASYGATEDRYIKNSTYNLKPGHSYYVYIYARTRTMYNSSPAWAKVTAGSFSSTRESFNITTPSSLSTEFGSKCNVPTTERFGYDFVGWFDENNNLMHLNWDYNGNQTFHAEWVIHEYSITYNLNGGKNNLHNPSSFVYTDNFDLSDPTKTGYEFNGWYTDPSFKNKVTSIDGSITKDVVLYAKWTPNTYTATLDYDGGQNCPTVSFYSQGDLIKSINLYKNSTLDYFIPESPSNNLKFGGWYTDPTFNNLYSFNGLVNTDLTLYAKWVDVSEYQYVPLGNNVNVQIDGNQYKYIAIVSPVNQTVTISSSSGLDLYGTIYDSNWIAVASCDDISDNNLDFSMTVTLQAGTVYYIGYKANQATTNGDCCISISGSNLVSSQITGDYTEVIETIAVVYDSSFYLPIPKKDGYVFVGWYDENGNLVDNSSWNYSQNITLYAHWVPIN